MTTSNSSNANRTIDYFQGMFEMVEALPISLHWQLGAIPMGQKSRGNCKSRAGGDGSGSHGGAARGECRGLPGGGVSEDEENHGVFVGGLAPVELGPVVEEGFGP